MHLVGFCYKNITRWTVLWMLKIFPNFCLQTCLISLEDTRLSHEAWSTAGASSTPLTWHQEPQRNCRQFLTPALPDTHAVLQRRRQKTGWTFQTNIKSVTNCWVRHATPHFEFHYIGVNIIHKFFYSIQVQYGACVLIIKYVKDQIIR